MGEPLRPMINDIPWKDTHANQIHTLSIIQRKKNLAESIKRRNAQACFTG